MKYLFSEEINISREYGCDEPVKNGDGKLMNYNYLLFTYKLTIQAHKLLPDYVKARHILKTPFNSLSFDTKHDIFIYWKTSNLNT